MTTNTKNDDDDSVITRCDGMEMDDSASIQFSPEDAEALMTILMDRGYFHKKATATTAATSDMPRAHPTKDDFNHNRYACADFDEYDKHGGSCHNHNNTVVKISTKQQRHQSASSSSYATLDRLRHDYTEELRRRGRWTVEDAAHETLGVSRTLLCDQIIRPHFVVCHTDGNEYTIRYDHANGTGDPREVLTEEYIQARTDELFRLLQEENSGKVGTIGGCMPVQTAADDIYNLPLEMTLGIVERRLASSMMLSCAASSSSRSIWMVRYDNGAHVLVTRQYWNRLRREVATIFQSLPATPVNISTVVAQNQWQRTLVQQILSHDNDDNGAQPLANDLPGHIHGDTYVPYEYTRRQKQSVLKSFATNGYITSHMCQTMFGGILPSQMKEYIVQDCNNNDDGENDNDTSTSSKNVLVLEHSVIGRSSIVVPLTAAVQDAMDVGGFVDCQPFLPIELLEHHRSDTMALVEVVRTDLRDCNGVVCVEDGDSVGIRRITGGIIYCSGSFISGFQPQLSELVQSLAQTRALNLFQSIQNDIDDLDNETVDGEQANKNGKEKRKERKAKSKQPSSMTGSEKSVAHMIGALPTSAILEKLCQAHPDMNLLEATFLSQICKKAFVSDKIESLFADTAVSELNRLELEQQRVSRSSAVAAAGDRLDKCGIRSAQAAFEDPRCFATACHMVQAEAKFLDYARGASFGDDDNAQNATEIWRALEHAFLAGCCADFTTRITQYVLYKHDVEEGVFSFYRNITIEGSEEESSFKQCCSQVDVGKRQYRATYLACGIDENGKDRQPLSLLRELLPGSIGIALARQWILCGGDCYQGGEKLSEGSGTTDSALFLSHIHENCLTICGLPFTNLDKKAEKKLLNARKLRLADLLEHADDAHTALELKIMLLYQLVKNLVVTGNLVEGPILRLLAQERKISAAVAEELLDVSNRLQRGEFVGKDAVASLKKLSLKKDKH